MCVHLSDCLSISLAVYMFLYRCMCVTMWASVGQFVCIYVSASVRVCTEQLASVPRLANLGPLFKSSSSPVELTESETEYIVRCVKHMFPHHVVFQVQPISSSNLLHFQHQLMSNVGSFCVDNFQYSIFVIILDLML